ncbi:MAG: PAS domain-containing sensor histidine kinase [Fulvivirga sp.]|uniref:PAS domain-containing sensor histidine kinase n=1 Tax=Fulvivirga sp. TaxID=1931237 RepID=UPI0032EEF89F
MVTEKNISQVYFEMMAENMIDLVGLHEPDGTYTYLSPSVENLLGYTQEELLGTNPYLLFHPEDISRIENESHRQAIAGKKIISTEYRIRKKNGEYIWFDTNTMPITDAGNRVIKLQTVSRDITEKKENEFALQILNKELDEINRQKDKLLSVISHDLRGPFNSLQGLLSIVLSDFNNLSKEELFTFLKKIQKQSQDSFSLLQDLLLWSRNQFNVIELEQGEINMKEAADRVICHLQGQADEKGLIIENQIPKPLVLNTDGHVFKTILRNLVSNAIKFSTEGSKIFIKSAQKDCITKFSVIDEGCGIDPDTIEKILNVKCIHTTEGTNGEKGFGLGIGICKDFVNKLGGNMQIESEVGKGSNFSFTIPSH